MGAITKELLFPTKGINRYFGFQSQPPYTGYDMLNVVPYDVWKLRNRGGTRPGLMKWSANYSSGPVRLLDTAYFKTNNRRDFWEDDFNSTSSSYYTTTLTNFTTLPSLANGLAYTDSSASLVVPAPSTIDTNTERRVTVDVIPYVAAHGATYELVFNLGSSPNYADCSLVRFALAASGTWSMGIYTRASSVESTVSTTTGDDTAVVPGQFTIVRNGTNIFAYWRGGLVLSATVATAGTGRFAATMTASANHRAQIDRLRLDYYHSNDFDRISPRVIASENGYLLADGTINSTSTNVALVGVTPLQRINVLRTLTNADRIVGTPFTATRYYFADFSSEVLASGTDGALGSTTFDSATYSDWTTVFSGVNFHDYVLHITRGNVSTGAGAGTYQILAVSSGNLTIAGGTSVSGCSWRIERCPKYSDVAEWDKAPIASGSDGVVSGGNAFDSATYADWNVPFTNKTGTDYVIEILDTNGIVTAEYPVSVVATGNLTIANATNGTGLSFRIVSKSRLADWRADVDPDDSSQTLGTVPVGCSIISAYMGRIVLAGDPVDANEVYFSAIGNAHNWRFGADSSDADKLSASNYADMVQGGVTALIPFGDTYLLICTPNKVFRLTDVPNSGGSMLLASRTDGCVSKTAWCYGATNSQVYILGKNGLMRTQIDCPSCELEPVSRDVLPKELQGVDPATFEVSMAFDVKRQWVHIWLTYKDVFAGNSLSMPQATHWIYDVRNEGFFPIQYADRALQPTAAVYYPSDSAADQGIITGGRGGSFYRHSVYAESDDGTAISNYAMIGPIMLGKDTSMAGMITSLWGRLAEDSADATAQLRVGRNAEVSATTSSYSSYTLKAASVLRTTPRKSGGAMTITIVGGARPWALESLGITAEPLGMLR